MNFYKQSLISLSGVASGYIGVMRGKSIPMYFVVEFPRSGGKWIGKMIAEYLGIDMPKGNLLPVMRKSVIHGHYTNVNIPNVIYVVRDGRDAVVSMAFKDLNRYLKGSNWDKDFIRNRYPSVASATVSDKTMATVLPQYISEWFARPTGTKVSWPNHVTKWLSKASGNEWPMVVLYEDMLENPVQELARIIKHISHNEADINRLTDICEKHSFFNQTGRKSGDALSHAERRKGIAGDWKNYFNKEAGRIFADGANSTLLQLGYEKEEDWYTSLDDFEMVDYHYRV